MYGRVDTTKYFNGARKIQNMVVLPQGGAFRRPGTAYQGESKSSNYAILRKFVFSVTQAYVLEFTTGFIRFWTTSGRVESPPGTAVEVVSPYLAADLPYLSFAQSADVIYITHPSYSPRKLSRLSNTSWTLTEVSFNDGPFLDVDESSNRLKVQVVSDITTLTLNVSGSQSAVASTSIFVIGDVGKFVEYVKYIDFAAQTHYGLAEITGYTSGTVVTVNTDVSVVDVSPAFATITFAASKVNSSRAIFNSTHVGKYIRLTASMTWYLITSIVHSTQVNVTAVAIRSYTPPGTTVIIQSGFAVGDVNKFVEYRQNDEWHLAKILTFASFDRVTVEVKSNLVIPEQSVDINLASSDGGNTQSNKTGVFSPRDFGKYVRDTETEPGNWGIITAYTDSDTVVTNVTTVPMFDYTFPTLTATLLDDRVITVDITSRDDLFTIDDIGKTVRVKYGANWRSVIITEFTSGLQVRGHMNDYMPYDGSKATRAFNNGWADKFRMPAWTATNGYPSICGFHAGRLWFANNTIKPTTLWGSEVDDYVSMSPSQPDGSVLDTNAITVTIASSRVNPITWIKSGPVMLIGTQGGEFQLKANNINQAITPSNVVVIPQTEYGSIVTLENSIRINSQTLFIQSGGLKIREMAYDFNIDAFASKDVSIIGEHLFRGATSSATNGNPLTTQQGVISMDSGTSPITVGWMVLSNGKVIGMTYEREQEVIAFHYHELGGNGVVESVCVTPDPVNSTDVVWFCVKRTINGSVKRYIESFSVVNTFSSTTTEKYVDCWKANVSTGSVGSPSGFDHLNAVTVQVLVDGIYIGTRTVSAGAFTLNYLVGTSTVAGFSSTAILGLLDPEGGSQAGTSQGKKKRVVRTTVRIERSPHFKTASAPGSTNAHETVMAGDDPTSINWKLIVPNITITAPGVTPAYPAPAAAMPVHYSGDILLGTDDSFNNGGRLQLLQDEPYPFKVIAVMHKLDTNE